MADQGGHKQGESEPISRVTATLDHTLVSSDATKPKKRRLDFKHMSRKKKLIYGLVLLVAVAAIGAVIYSLVTDEKDPTIRDLSVTSEGVVLRQLDAKDLQTEVDKLIFQKKITSAAELITYQHNAKDKETQLLLATVYMNQEKHQEALTILLAVDKSSGGDWTVTRNIATEYDRQGDKSQAVTYYKKSLDQLKAADNVPVKEDEIYFLNQDIKRLGG